MESERHVHGNLTSLSVLLHFMPAAYPLNWDDAIGNRILLISNGVIADLPFY